MYKDINCINVVLAEKGGAARLQGVSWRTTKEPISGWQSIWDVPLLPYQNGVPMTASQQWRHSLKSQNYLMWD